jgi:hypothetical protein
MMGLLLVVAFAAAQPAAAAPPAPAAPPLPYSVTFARSRIGPWNAEAQTIVDDTTGRPLIDQTKCDIERSGLQLTMWPQGGLWFELNNNGDPHLGFGRDDIRRIGFDGETWEMRQIDITDTGFDHFVDVVYPPPRPRCYDCLRVTSSYWVARRRAGDPYFIPQVLTDRLVRARMLRVGFQDEVDEGETPGPIMWAEIPLAGLDRAIAWCREAMASDRARLFHSEIGRRP